LPSSRLTPALAHSSLPARDLPSYYDPPSSPSAASGSDGEGAVDGLASAVPTTNRGHKLSRLAPHTRRGRLGHHANVDAGFVDDTTSTSLVPPAQKRRKLNDLAAASSTSGFAVAPNLHLVPRSVHTLSREPDAPYPAHLPPVPQSPLDLLLTPAVQHTLGRKNNTFHLLSASATSLIEQEAELVGALTQVCRGLRGEGFDWRWDGDDERRRERDETRRKVDDEERKVDEDKEQGTLGEAVASASAAQPAANGEAAAPAPATAAADGMDVEASPAPTATTSALALEDEVKLEQATPVLSAPSAPGAVADPVPVPGLSPAPPAAPAALEGVEQAAATPAAPASAQDVEMKDAAEPTAAEGAAAEGSGTASASDAAAAAPTAAAAEGATAPAGDGVAPVAAPSAQSEVPAIAVTAAGAEDASGAGAPPAPAPAPAPNGTGEAEQLALGAGTPVEPTAPSADTPAAADPLATPTLAAAAAVDSGDVASTEATPAPSLSEEPSIRRRSGRVARGAAGAVPGRHTRSRQSSPEEGYTDAEDEAEGAGEGSSLDEPLAAGGAAGGAAGAGSRPPRAPQLIEEEELPEYAARLVDPEVFVRGLFVSEGDVEMERVVPGPGGGMVGTGQMETCVPLSLSASSRLSAGARR